MFISEAVEFKSVGLFAKGLVLALVVADVWGVHLIHSSELGQKTLPPEGRRHGWAEFSRGAAGHAG